MKLKKTQIKIKLKNVKNMIKTKINKVGIVYFLHTLFRTPTMQTYLIIRKRMSMI